MGTAAPGRTDAFSLASNFAFSDARMPTIGGLVGRCVGRSVSRIKRGRDAAAPAGKILFGMKFSPGLRSSTGFHACCGFRETTVFPYRNPAMPAAGPGGRLLPQAKRDGGGTRVRNACKGTW